MAQQHKQIREVMTKDPITLPATASLTEAARKMKEGNIGDIIVMRGPNIGGIVTDRDIVVRAIADGKDPDMVTLEEVCSEDVATVSPEDEVSAAIELMRSKAVRRVPVTENGRPIGIVSLGDLAQLLDRRSALGDISAHAPNV